MDRLKELNLSLILHSLFWIGYMLALTQYFEYAVTLKEHGWMEDAFYSTNVVHHGYWGFFFIAAVWLYSNADDYWCIMDYLYLQLYTQGHSLYSRISKAFSRIRESPLKEK